MPATTAGRDDAVRGRSTGTPAPSSGVRTVFEGLIAQTSRATGASSGSVSVVDARGGRYLKAAERGVACQVGRSFPLEEGITGLAVAARRPVAVEDYSTLPGGHLRGAGAAGHGTALAVPLWWRDQVIGVNVAFAPRGVRFASRLVDDLEALTQRVAAAVLAGDGSAAGTVLARIRSSPPLDGLAPAGPAYPAASGAGPLTAREIEVLALVRSGASDRAVAVALGLSVKTVEKHVGALLRKTGAQNRTGAVVIAAERGWGLGPR